MRYYRHLAASLALAAAPPAFAQTFTMPPITVADPVAGGSRVTADGLVANWYPATGEARRPAILLLGGSEGGIGGGAARQAADLVAHGYAVLHLAYFGAPGLPPALADVPLGYFDRALAWLRRQPGVAPDRIALVGGSKGAEAALLIAARDARVRAVVAGSPSAAVWPGIDVSASAPRSSWSSDGVPLDYLRYGDRATSVFDGYRAGLATLPAHPRAAIPVGHIRAKVLLVCGRADTLWPSCAMATIVAHKMAARTTVLGYADAGHAVFGPPVAVDAPGYASLGTFGGSPAGNDAARADAWPKILAFLASTLDDAGKR